MGDLATMTSRTHRLRTIFLIVALLCTLLLCTGYYLLGYALRPESLARSRDIEGSLQYMLQEYPVLRTWVDSLQNEGAIRRAALSNERGENLQALYVEAARPTDKTAVIVHGYTDNAIRMMMIGYLYHHTLGYNILLPDLHAHGMSDGEAIQMGWLDREDILQWMVYADELFGRNNEAYKQLCDSLAQTANGSQAPSFNGNSRMVVHGISMGAATTMMVSGEVNHGSNLMPFVKCFVEDCGYTSVWDEFRSELKTQFGLPAFPLLHLADLLCRHEYGWGFREASALNQVRKCNLPMLFIHGESDTFVPTWMVHPLYEAKPQPKELWIAPGSDHAHAYRDHPEEYAMRVRHFTEKYIP